MTDEEVAELTANIRADVYGSYGNEMAYSREKLIEAVNNVRERYQVLLGEKDIEIAKRAAKIFAYEAIISNSNFKMAVIKQKEGRKCES